MSSKALPLNEVHRRLRLVDGSLNLQEGADGLLVFARTVPPFFPYANHRHVAYHFPKYYSESGFVIPAENIDDILLHLFLSTDEEEEFWKIDSIVH